MDLASVPLQKHQLNALSAHICRKYLAKNGVTQSMHHWEHYQILYGEEEREQRQIKQPEREVWRWLLSKKKYQKKTLKVYDDPN